MSPSRPARVPHFVRGSDVEDVPVRWLEPGFVPSGMFTLIDGDPGVNKSLLAIDLAARLTRGAQLPGGNAEPAGEVLVINPEDRGPDVCRRLEAAGGDVARLRLMMTPGPRTARPVDLGKDFARLRDHFRDPLVRLAIIDSVAMLLGSARTDAQTRQLLWRIARLAEESDTAVIGIRHLTKRRSGQAMMQGAGGVGIVGSARVATLLLPHPTRTARRIWLTTKSNLGPPPDAWEVEIKAGAVPTLRWLRQSGDWDADELLRTTTGAPKADTARRLLVDVLAEGPRLRNDIMMIAKTAGVGWRTVQEAKTLLGVESVQSPEPGRRGPGQSWWRLSEGTDG